MTDKEQEKIGMNSGGSAPEPEKRKNLRNHLLVLRVKGEASGNVFFGYAKNISKSGMFVSSVYPKEVGEKFTIEFTLPKKKKPIRCQCIVKWCRNYDPKSKYEPGMGVSFLDLDKKERKAINECVIDSSPFV
jgi:uncharacterized protein (TIGR02266 family)